MAEKCSVESCKSKAVSDDGLCRKHHTERKYDEWLDNTDPDNLGIVKWVKDCIPHYAYNDVSDIHKEMYLSLLSLYNPVYRNKYERRQCFVSFRGSAKSALANTMFSMYILANNGKYIKLKLPVTYRNKRGKLVTEDRVVLCQIKEKLIVIISETATSAEEFTVRIRDEFDTNEILRYYYSFQIEDLEQKDGKWTRTDFKFNGCSVVALGTGQQVRGKVKGVSRPTLVILDDLYSEKNCTTEVGRNKISKWFFNAMFNSVDDLLGKVVLLGTIVHEDTVLVKCRKSRDWRTKVFTVMPVERYNKFISEHLTIDHDRNKCYLPFDDINEESVRTKNQKDYFDKLQLDEDWGLAWPDRIDLYYLAKKTKSAVEEEKSLSGLYQEYFHITQSPQDRRFKHEHFRTKKHEHRYAYGYNWIRFPEDPFNPQWQICNIYFGSDLAGGNATGDDHSITIGAVLADGHRHVMQQVCGKFSIRDTLFPFVRSVKNLVSSILGGCTVTEDRTKIQKIGVVDELFRLYKIFHPKEIKIGTAGEETQVVDECRRVFDENHVYDTTILKRPQTQAEGNKIRRIVNGLLPGYETGITSHAPGLQDLEYDLEFLGTAEHDDKPDSEEVCFWRVEPPEELTLDMFDREPAPELDINAALRRRFIRPEDPEDQEMETDWHVW